MKESNQDARSAAEKDRYIHALELQVETFALLASRLGSLLQPTRESGSEYQMPYLRSSSRKGRSPMAAVEVALGSPSSEAPTRAYKRSETTHPTKKVRAPHPNKGKKLAWWAKLSKEQKAAIIAKRVAGHKKTRKEAA